MGKTPGKVQFSQLVDMFSPAAVLEEVKNIFINSYPVGSSGVKKVERKRGKEKVEGRKGK
jgi:hypothetical protein